MEGPRSGKKEDFKEIINLINHVFRTTRGHKATMHQEFPLLLNESNIDNLIGIYDKGKPVSQVNFVEEKILIEGAEIKAASIGGVCTHEDYREKNYASKILDKVEEKMYEKAVDLVLISGDRTLYTRRQCMKVKNFYEYIIKPKHIEEKNIDGKLLNIEEDRLSKIRKINNSSYKNNNTNIKLVNYEYKYLNSMVKIYNLNSTRYYRTYDEFKTLLHSSTISWGSFSYKKYVILEDEACLGYIILRTIDEKEKYGQVVEALGNVDYIYEALGKICYDLNLKYIKHYVHVRDEFNNLINHEDIKKDYLHGTVKVINFKKFMEDLKPYFAQYIEKDILNSLNFREDEKGYGIIIGEESLYVNSLGEITKLIFEGVLNEESWESLNLNLNHKPNIKKFIEAVFPIPFVWPANLNYQ